MVHLGLKPCEFRKLTYQDYWLLMLQNIKRRDEIAWIHGDLKAHIANCTVRKKEDPIYTYKDFVRLSGEKEQEVKKPEPASLKKAKQLLGSKFNLN